MSQGSKSVTPRVFGIGAGGAFSGTDDVVLSLLDRRGALVGRVNGVLPKAIRLGLLAASVRYPRRRWYSAWSRMQIKSSVAWFAKTAVVDRVLRARQDEYDVVLHHMGIFAPFLRTNVKPVVLYCDYTTKLAERNYPRWLGLSGAELKRWYAREEELYNTASRIIAMSENARQSFISDYGVKPERVVVIPPGGGTPLEHPRTPRAKRAIAFVGIDFERKGGFTVLKAFELAKKRFPDAELHIVGPNRLQDCVGVTWHGFVSGSKALNTILDQCQFALLPSICEPFGKAIVECMARGLPVIGSRADAGPEIIQDGVTGYTVPPGDVQLLADRMADLLECPERTSEYGERARLAAIENYNWERNVDRMIQVLSAAARGTLD